MTAFAEAFLFHVTRTSALAGIKREGLLPASFFLNRQSSPVRTIHNRDIWTRAPDSDGQAVWLRRQNLRDEPLRKCLPATITPAEWRSFINGMVFLFTTLTKAQGLQAHHFDREFSQTIIRCRTTELLGAGRDIRVCRWNNGYLDRSRPPRLRTFADYLPVSEWQKIDKVQEVAVVDGIPAPVSFEVVGG